MLQHSLKQAVSGPNDLRELFVLIPRDWRARSYSPHGQGDRILIPCNDVDRRLESDLITGS